MVKIAQNRQPLTELRTTRFANKRLDPIGVELLTLSELRARVSAKLLFKMERVEFFMVLVATGDVASTWSTSSASRSRPVTLSSCGLGKFSSGSRRRVSKPICCSSTPQSSSRMRRRSSTRQ
jgi:hypothetical protein